MLSRYVSSGTRCFVSRVILIGLIGLPVLSADDVSEENRPVDDVLQAFDALAHHGEWLGFHNGAGAPARTDIFSKNHIQGLARSPRPGTPYFFLCSSGAWLDSGDSDANLMVVEMGSRDESGERLRSNRLLRSSQTSCTPPDRRDRVVVNITFPNYRHPGGMQMVGDILIVPFEGRREDTGFCDGGSHHGGSCSSDGECPARCVGRECEGGSNDGDPCTSITDCDGGGDCVGEGACEGGSNEGDACSDHIDCASSQGACALDRVCEGGSNDGDPCASMDDCDNGDCVSVGTCEGGAYAGYACNNDTDCPASGGTCILEGVCSGGPNAGKTCGGNGDCPSSNGYCGSLGTCVGGGHSGDDCEFDKDCYDEGVCYGLPEARILFYDMSDPLAPDLIYTLSLNDAEVPFDDEDQTFKKGMEAGFAGITKLPDGHFLLMVGWHAGKDVAFWRSNKPSFFDDDFRFEFHDYWPTSELQGGLEVWPVGTTAHQNYSLVNQAPASAFEEGRIFMIGGRNTNVAAPVAPGEDRMSVYEITGFASGEEIVIEQLRRERIFTLQNDSSFMDYWTLSPEICSTPVYGDIPFYPVELTNADLLAGSTTYVSPSGELLYYAATHYNDGVVGAGEDRIVRIAELRHEHVVRDDSSTYQPLADSGGPYSVDEGSAIQLDGGASQPTLAAPWAQLFEHTVFDGQSVMFDYADRNKDDYKDFGRLDGDALLWPCLDLEALTEITADGKSLVMDEILPMNLTIDDFTYETCFLFEAEGECWIRPPYAGEEGTVIRRCFMDSAGVVPGIPIGDDCWATPPIPALRGHHECAWGVCTPCLPALPGQSENCDITPAIPGTHGHWLNMCYVDPAGVVPGLVIDNVCYAVPPIAGEPGFSMPVPDPAGRGWTVVPDLLDLVERLPTVVEWFEDCGRLVGGDLREPPPHPDLLDVLDPATYDEDGDGVPDAVQDLEAFFDLFPALGTDVFDAIGEVLDYSEALVEYIDELLTTIHGFNDRASSVRWYAPAGTDIVLHDKTDYRGAQLVLEGTGTVGAISNLGDFLLTKDDGSAGHDAHDRIRSMRFEGTFAPPVMESYVWSILSAVPPDSFVLHDPTTSHPTLDTYGADGPTEVTVELVVVDSLGAASSVAANVDVLNVAPILDGMGPDRTIAEGDTVALAPVIFSDPGIPDTHSATIDWGDGSPVRDGVVTQNLVSGGGQVDGSHAYGDNGTFVVTVTVTDDDGGIGSGSFTVEVSNLDPVPTLDTSSATPFRAGPAFTGRIGIEQLHDASARDAGSDDLRFVWTATEEITGDRLMVRQADHFNNGQDPDPFPSGPGTFPFEADDQAAVTFVRPGVYLLSVSVSDDDAGSAEGHLPKLVTGDSDRAKAIGAWRQDFAGQLKNGLEDRTLLGLLRYVNFASSYFAEQVPAIGIEQALAVLRPGGTDLGDPDRANLRGKAVQSVFATWLNVASGALDLNGSTADGSTVIESLYAAEDILADPSTTRKDHLLILRRMNSLNH